MDAANNPWDTYFTVATLVDRDDFKAYTVAGGYFTDGPPADPTAVPDSDIKRLESSIEEYEEEI